MNILGIIFHNLKKLDKAINFYKQAIINNQSYYPAYNLEMHILIKMN